MSRVCGPCRACCTVLAVPELSKAADQPCPSADGFGCRVYAERPASCRAFECLWLSDRTDRFNNMDRPNESGLIFSVQYGTEFGDIMTAYETRPGVRTDARAMKLLRRISRQALVMAVGQAGRSFHGPTAELRRVHRILEAAKRQEAEARLVIQPDKA